MMSTLAVAADRWEGGPPPFWPIFPLLWLGVLAAAALVTVVILNRRNRLTAGPRAGEARLAERFAAGEIDEAEYSSRLEVLRRR